MQTANKMKSTFVISKIEGPEANSAEATALVERLHELGLYPGLKVNIVAQISFGAVTVIRYGSTTLALNQEEFLCLHGH